MKRINPHQDSQRSVLKVVGILLVLAGAVFTLIGVGSLFSSFGSFGGPPKAFFCTFIGIPMLGIGSMICKFAFLGTVARYTAGEIAPVGKDVVNYMASETKEGVKEIAAAVSEGQKLSKGDVRARLKKLELLKAEGLISEEDFEEQKDRILDEI